MGRKGEKATRFACILATGFLPPKCSSPLVNNEIEHSHLLYLLPVLGISLCHFFYLSTLRDTHKRPSTPANAVDMMSQLQKKARTKDANINIQRSIASSPALHLVCS